MTDPTTATSADYLTDVAYTSAYYDYLNPTLLNYVCAINGYRPRRSGEAFSYLELGCGHGLTTNVLASAYPYARFFGVDFNAEHIRSARELAAAGMLDNVTFIEESFARLLSLDLPDLDYITLHGVYAWVSKEMRTTILDFIAAKLRPGGIVFVSYNAMPGWSAFAPMRTMMLAYTAPMQVDSLQKARHGLTYLRFLLDNGAKYFIDNPNAKRVLEEELEKADLRYIAHEYFNQHWSPQYFADMVQALGSRGLEFAGSLPVSLNYRDLCLPRSVQKIFSTAPNRHTLEVHKDFVRNERFRCDVYLRPAEPQVLPEPAHFDGLSFGSVMPREKISTEFKTPAGKILLTGKAFEPLIDALCSGPKSWAALREHPELAHLGAETLHLAIQRLMVTAQFQPCATPAPEPQPMGERLRPASTLNRVLLERGVAARQPVVQASTVLGGGTVIAWGEALMLQAVYEAGLDAAPDHAQRTLAAHGGALILADGQRLTEPERVAAELCELRDAYRERHAARLCALGLARPDELTRAGEGGEALPDG